jgi:hypothetical protein
VTRLKYRTGKDNDDDDNDDHDVTWIDEDVGGGN